MRGRRAAILLAAGQSTRFGSSSKLLAPWQGRPLILHAIEAARAAPVDRIVIVKRPGEHLDRLCRDAANDDGRIVLIDLDSDALSLSLQAGLAAAGDVDGAYIFLGDMPQVPHHVADLLAHEIGSAFAAIPTHEGLPGHPVLLSRQAIALTATLSGDQGAGKMLRGRGDVLRIELPDNGTICDVDTPADLTRLDHPPLA